MRTAWSRKIAANSVDRLEMELSAFVDEVIVLILMGFLVMVSILQARPRSSTFVC